MVSTRSRPPRTLPEWSTPRALPISTEAVVLVLAGDRVVDIDVPRRPRRDATDSGDSGSGDDRPWPSPLTSAHARPAPAAPSSLSRLCTRDRRQGTSVFGLPPAMGVSGGEPSAAASWAVWKARRREATVMRCAKRRECVSAAGAITDMATKVLDHSAERTEGCTTVSATSVSVPAAITPHRVMVMRNGIMRKPVARASAASK
mmetsp:Transcript_15873/g.55262  ORF Transcript_15873/g.55262 Transcript_15873/m.55262 type:complete len:203 (-) Transcript_15873:1040-1648(-)